MRRTCALAVLLIAHAGVPFAQSAYWFDKCKRVDERKTTSPWAENR